MGILRVVVTFFMAIFVLVFVFFFAAKQRDAG